MDIERQKLFSEVKALFCTENPNSVAFDIFENSGCPVTAIEELIAYNHHDPSIENAIKFFLSRYSFKDEVKDQLPSALRDILIFAATPANTNNHAFISKLAELHLLCYTYIYQGKYEYPKLPQASMVGTVILDLASGYDFSNFLNNINTDTIYYAVDKSLFATEVILQKARALNLTNILTLNTDVLHLRRSDISQNDIEIIRAKNIFRYVPHYLDVFHKHLGWLCDGGKFIFAEQSSDKNANASFLHRAVIDNFVALIRNGWGVTYEFASIDNPMNLNSLSFIKSSKTNSQTEIPKLQRFYEELNRIYNFDQSITIR